MDGGEHDARWHRLLSLAVHEFRTPITVVAGYIRMILKDRAGPVNDGQRKLLEEAERSCGRLSALVAEMSDLASLEREDAPLRRTALDLQPMLEGAIAALPAMQDREVTVELQRGVPVTVSADAVRLQTAIVSLLAALRREVVTSDRLVVRTDVVDTGGARMARLAIGDAESIGQIAGADPATLSRFDEWRGGLGLSLAIARRIIGQHGGALLSPPGDGRAGAVVTLPRE
jgi:signal transduction histidine kinase